MLAVAVENLTRRFGKFTAVDGISFTVDSGEIFGFLGPNGAGKSTTIRMLCGILAPSSGSIQVAGFDAVRQPEQVKQIIGYMSQRFSLYEDLTVGENIDFYAGIYEIPLENQRMAKERVLELTGLADRAELLSRELSGGWKQRLGLGCAIVHRPPLLFLDEPTSGVDPISRRRFWDLIRDLSDEGTTVFVSTHFMDEAEHCNHIAFINNGKLASLGSPTELKENSNSGSLEEAFIFYARSGGARTG
jgi:ABC-2 type transport system ATP-binding protein